VPPRRLLVVRERGVRQLRRLSDRPRDGGQRQTHRHEQKDVRVGGDARQRLGVARGRSPCDGTKEIEEVDPHLHGPRRLIFRHRRQAADAVQARQTLRHRRHRRQRQTHGRAVGASESARADPRRCGVPASTARQASHDETGQHRVHCGKGLERSIKLASKGRFCKCGGRREKREERREREEREREIKFVRREKRERRERERERERDQ
jgi:hypothetical protein